MRDDWTVTQLSYLPIDIPHPIESHIGVTINPFPIVVESIQYGLYIVRTLLEPSDSIRYPKRTPVSHYVMIHPLIVDVVLQTTGIWLMTSEWVQKSGFWTIVFANQRPSRFGNCSRPRCLLLFSTERWSHIDENILPWYETSNRVLSGVVHPKWMNLSSTWPPRSEIENEFVVDESTINSRTVEPYDTHRYSSVRVK